jgi:hypothetical protein
MSDQHPNCDSFAPYLLHTYVLFSLRNYIGCLLLVMQLSFRILTNGSPT